MPDYRAHFDADVEFVNGGRLTAEGFRLDIPGPNLANAEIAELFIQHLGLALVGKVQLQSVQIARKPTRARVALPQRRRPIHAASS